jgi:hypothetical protein
MDIKQSLASIELEVGNISDPKLKLIFRHEHFGSRFEGIFRTDYRTAHNAAERARRPSGIQDIDSFEFELGVKKWDY